MRKISKTITNPTIYNKLLTFLDQYGENGLLDALNIYTESHQKYICKTKTSITKLNIYDIYYITIHGHNIKVHTEQNVYRKYGSLSQELKILADHGFIKCSQSCIVSLNKIKQIVRDDIILLDGTKLHISKNYITSVLIAYNQQKAIPYN